MLDLRDAAGAAPSPPTQDDAASPSFADFGSAFDAYMGAKEGAGSPDDAAAPDASQATGTADAATPVAEATTPVAEAVTPVPAGDGTVEAAPEAAPATEVQPTPPAKSERETELERQLAEAQEAIRANDRERWEAQQRANARQEEAWYDEALTALEAGRDAAHDEILLMAEEIYDPDKRRAWIKEKFAEVNREFVKPELRRIDGLRAQRIQGQARATIEQIGRGPFAQSLVAKHGLTEADVPALLAGVQMPNGSVRPPTGGEIAARAGHLKLQRAQEAKERENATLHEKVRQLEALVARGTVAGSGASALPGTGSPLPPSGGFDYARLNTTDRNDPAWDEGLDYLMAQMGFGN